MPGQIPNVVGIYRIIHIDNVEYVLTNGMFIRHHANADPKYINIGNTALITKRNEYPVKISPPNGVLGDYIPFYFGPLSPMLLKIKDGNGGITRRPQQDIVYIICRLDSILQHCANWCFTDGHAKTAITDFYNDIKYLNEVDWNLVEQRYWGNTEDDFDRMRRKQAEFLIKDHVPVNCISAIVTYNADAQNSVQSVLSKLALNIAVSINPNNKFYY